MKIIWGLLVTAISILRLASAIESLTNLSLPACSSRCLDAALQLQICSSTDEVCLCKNNDFVHQLEGCMNDNCTVREFITAKNATTTACEFEVRDKRSTVIWVAAVGGTIAYISIFLRLYTRQFITQGDLGLDDWSTIATAVFLAPLTAGAILLAKNGLGKDIWTLPFHSIDSTLYIFYIQEHLYVIATVLVKISFLLFYFRIFPDATFRKVVGATLIFAVCFGISALFAFAFQCTPIDRAWHGWDDEHPGSCVNINVLVLTAAALNICADFWIIVLPIPGIIKLQSSIRMRLQISAMFCTGFFITGVSTYRAIMLTNFATTYNPTWDWCDGGYWSIIEVDVGILCTNMPAIRSLLGRVIPKVFGSTAKATATEPSRTAGRSSHTPRGIRSFKGSRTEAESFIQLIDMDSRSAKNQPDNKSSYS